MHKLICYNRSKRLSKVSDCSTLELWVAVKPKSESNQFSLLNNPQMVNKFFSWIATDPEYVPGDINKLYWCPNRNRVDLKTSNFPIEGYQMGLLLLHLKNTAPGLDNISWWVFRKCSVELADVIAYIVNYSFTSVCTCSCRYSCSCCYSCCYSCS